MRRSGRERCGDAVATTAVASARRTDTYTCGGPVEASDCRLSEIGVPDRAPIPRDSAAANAAAMSQSSSSDRLPRLARAISMSRIGQSATAAKPICHSGSHRSGKSCRKVVRSLSTVVGPGAGHASTNRAATARHSIRMSVPRRARGASAIDENILMPRGRRRSDDALAGSDSVLACVDMPSHPIFRLILSRRAFPRWGPKSYVTKNFGNGEQLVGRVGNWHSSPLALTAVHHESGRCSALRAISGYDIQTRP